MAMMLKQTLMGVPAKEDAICDSGLSLNCFADKNKVSNMRPAENAIDVGTNGGNFKINQVADVHNCGPVPFNPNSMTNIFSLAKLTDGFRVTFDSAQENAIIVHTDSGPVKFVRTVNDLCALDPESRKQM